MPIGRLGGSGGGGGRGGSASVGVLLRQTGENDKGLFLTASGADLTWHGRGESVGDTDPAIGSHVDLPNNGGGPGVNRHAYLRLRFPADITGYSGADSNNIVVRLNRLDAVAASPVVVWNAGTLTITVGASTSFSTLATAIAAFTTFTITTSQSDNAVGTDIFRLGADASGTNYNATGGRDEIEPGIELLAQPEDAVNGPNILAKYDPDNHTLQQILDELEDNDQGVTVTVPYGTDLTAAPEAVPWMRGFDAGIGPTEAPTTGTGGLTRDQVDARVRVLAKGYALRGGPIVPDSEIPDQEARDAEVPALLSSALTTRAPDSANYNDELPFLNSSGDWSKATSQVWRTFFKPNLQEWGNSPAGFVYRVGDIVPHNGGTYYCQTQHTKNTQTGPDGDDRWLPLRAFWGAWTARFYPTGTWVLHSSDLWLATEDVSNTETPGVSNKWHRVTNQAGLVLGGDWNSTATYRARRLIRHSNPANAWYLTTQDVPSGNEPGVASNWTTYYERISWVDGAPDDVTGFSITGATFRANKRDGSHEQHTLPSGGTEVAANPAGSDGDVLRRIDIGGRNWIIESETTVGMGSLSGRRTTTLGKFPADLADHTNPIEVPRPRRFTEGWAAMAASRDWPIIPVSGIADDGGFISSYNPTDNSVVLAEGMYIINMLTTNLWINDIDAGTAWSGNNALIERANNAQRVAVEFDVEQYKPNAVNAMAQITPNPASDTQTYLYVTLGEGALGPAGNEWSFKTQYLATLGNNTYSIVADVAEKEILLSIRGSLATTVLDDIIADLNGELNDAAGDPSGIHVSCFDSDEQSGIGARQIMTWATSDGTLEFQFAGGSDWDPIGFSNAPYVRYAPYARQVTTSGGATSSQSPGSDDSNDGTGAADYSGQESPVQIGMDGSVAIPPGGATVRFRMLRGRTFADNILTANASSDAAGSNATQRYDALLYPYGLSGGRGSGTTPWGYFCDVPKIDLFPLGRPTQTAPITPTPHITSFDSISGDRTPAAGSIANEVYGYSYTIAQGSHVGAARIIGFKGSTKPSGSVNVLATLTDTDHGAGSVNIPADVTLAANEQYRIRLQIFAEGVTPGPDTEPLNYQDIVIRAHAPTTAAYHWGRVARVENQDAATYAAAIVFSTDDLETGTTLDTTDGYDATPDTTGNWIFYLAAQDGQTQPTGWTSGGFPANAVFQDSVDQDFSSVTYKVYIMNDAFYRTADDGTVNYRPVTS